jgi:hypothetical protein
MQVMISAFNIQTVLLLLGMILLAVGMGLAFGAAAALSVVGFELISTALIIDRNSEGR